MLHCETRVHEEIDILVPRHSMLYKFRVRVSLGHAIVTGPALKGGCCRALPMPQQRDRLRGPGVGLIMTPSRLSTWAVVLPMQG